MLNMMTKRSAGSCSVAHKQAAARPVTIMRSAAGGESTAPGSGIDWLKAQPGITEPFPGMFDPANFSATVSIKEVKRWRESEIVHGRVAMLAALGFIVGEQLEDFPAFVNFDGQITGPAITQFQQVRQGFWEPLLIVIGIAESYRVAVAWATPQGKDFNYLKEDYVPGDLGFDPLGLKPTEPAALKEMQTKEINNGRLAMIAIAAFVAQELVEQTEIFEHLFINIEKEAILELDDIERDIGLPVTPVPVFGN